MSVQPRLAAESIPNLIVLDSKVPDTIIWPVAGGKGGTGKSTLTANLGVGLSLLGYKVILVDGDLGGADLPLFFDQISPPRSLSSFLTKEVPSLNDGLQVPDRLHRFTSQQSRKLSQVAKAEEKFW